MLSHNILNEMSPLDLIVALNNKGCQLLGTEQLDDAVAQFKLALMCLRSNLQGNHQNNRTMACVTSLPSLVPLNVKDIQQILSTHQQSWRQVSSDRWMLPPDHRYVTFSWAIPLLSGHPFSTEGADNENVYAAILVFNLAVVLHFKALQHSSSSFHDLQKAKTLYLHAQTLIAPMTIAFSGNGQTSDNVAFDLLIIGLLNNTALIHMELFQYTDCHVASARLIQYVTMISSFRSRDGCPPNVPGGHHALPTLEDEVWPQGTTGQIRFPLVTLSSDGGEEPCQIVSMVNDMLLNAIYITLHIGITAAAA
jgi:hypothetical protein